ncbi:MAG TPA: acyl-CoA dehydrogenase [Acidimicrobiia bacterium]|nr:acyl-CoA dehydrogenase [Acidimicrobiia bacterium]
MRFAFTDDQLEFRDAVRDLLAKECPPAAVRAAWDPADRSPGGSSIPGWAALEEMGVLGVLVPEVDGGLGLTEVDLVLLLEESGVAALPGPIVEHAMVGAPLVGGRLEPGSVLSAPFSHDAMVPYSDVATNLLMFDAGAWHFVARDAVDLRPLPSVDHVRRLSAVAWTAAPATVVAEGAAAARAFDRGALGTAAQLVGLARRMILMTVEYVAERRQFGVPVGSFQAVKHHLADARIALEFARPLVYRAAWSLATDDVEASIHVSMAKAQASDAATLAARKALQCHGAIGYSDEHDLHLFMKRTWALAAAWGDAPWHRDRVGRAIL